MKKTTWTITIIFLLLAGPVTAQFYRYIDYNGNLRFMDDYNKIPADQRANIREYPEFGLSPIPGVHKNVNEIDYKANAKAAKEHENVTFRVIPTAADGTISLKELRAQIEKMKEQLELEYLLLTNEKDTLSKRRYLKTSREELDAYNKSVDVFNQRADNYEKLSVKLSNLVNDYNTFVIARNAN